MNRERSLILLHKYGIWPHDIWAMISPLCHPLLYIANSQLKVCIGSFLIISWETFFYVSTPLKSISESKGLVCILGGLYVLFLLPAYANYCQLKKKKKRKTTHKPLQRVLQVHKTLFGSLCAVVILKQRSWQWHLSKVFAGNYLFPLWVSVINHCS